MNPFTPQGDKPISYVPIMTQHELGSARQDYMDRKWEGVDAPGRPDEDEAEGFY